VRDTLTALIRAAGLPAPIREHRFAPPRRWRFDYAWPAHRLALEVEGGTWAGGRHVRGRGYEADCEKYSEAALRGWRVLRVTTNMLNDGRALAMLERALRGAAAL
jgi:very-short-patch-repair endonuclease